MSNDWRKSEQMENYKPSNACKIKNKKYFSRRIYKCVKSTIFRRIFVINLMFQAQVAFFADIPNIISHLCATLRSTLKRRRLSTKDADLFVITKFCSNGAKRQAIHILFSYRYFLCAEQTRISAGLRMFSCWQSLYDRFIAIRCFAVYKYVMVSLILLYVYCKWYPLTFTLCADYYVHEIGWFTSRPIRDQRIRRKTKYIYINLE